MNYSRTTPGWLPGYYRTSAQLRPKNYGSGPLLLGALAI